jgi:hypothetical protein
LVNVEVTGLQKMLKLVSLRLKTQADTNVVAAGVAEGVAIIEEMARTDQAGTCMFTVAEYSVAKSCFHR